MKQLLAVLFLICMIGCAHDLRQTRINARDLEYKGKYQIIGKLGMPLCHLMEVHAKFTYGDDTEYCLEISRVGAAALKTHIRMPFSDNSYEVPNNDFDRYEQLFGKKIGCLADTQIKQLREGWINTEYDLVVYEKGYFGGPDNIEEFDVMSSQGMGPGLETRLVVEKVLKKYEPPEAEVIAWLKPEYLKVWDDLNRIHGPVNIVVLSSTELEINGIRCRLLGVSQLKDPNKQSLAKKFLELYVADYGKYHSIYNGIEPVCDTAGIPLIWLHGSGNGGWAQETLVQAGLVNVDYKGYEKYTFTTQRKSGSKPCEWKKILANAEESFRRGEKPNVNFEWPGKQ